MRYWDSSAVVPLLVNEPRSKFLYAALTTDPEMVTWWGSRIECHSAIQRVVRSGSLGPSEASQAEKVLAALAARWLEIGATEIVRETAERLLRTHVLRAGDSLQLAAAVVAADFRPAQLELVCCDERLARAGRREGFPVVGVP